MLKGIAVALQVLAMIGGGLGYLVGIFFCTVWWGLPGLVVSAFFVPIELIFPIVYLAQAGLDGLFVLLCLYWTCVGFCAAAGWVLEYAASAGTAGTG